MPGKKMGKKMALADFTGGVGGPDIIPTRTEDLASDIARNQADREARQAGRAQATAPGSHYGARGDAAVAASWRGGSSQPDAPPPAREGGGGGGGGAGRGKQYGFKGAGDWTRGVAQPGDEAQDGKAFGGTGFGRQPGYGGGGGGGMADLTRDAFGGARPGDGGGGGGGGGGGERRQGYNPVTGGPQRGGGGGQEISRDFFGGNRPPPAGPGRGNGPQQQRGPPPGGVGGGGQRATFAPDSAIGRDAFGATAQQHIQAPETEDGKWRAQGRGQRRDRREVEEARARWMQGEQEREQEHRARIAGKLGDLDARADPEGPRPPRRRPADGGNWRDNAAPPRRSDRDARQDPRGAGRGPLEERVVITKDADALLGVVCDGLRLNTVKPGSAADRCRVNDFIGWYLVAVNSSAVSSMDAVRQAAQGQRRLVLHFSRCAPESANTLNDDDDAGDYDDYYDEDEAPRGWAGDDERREQQQDPPPPEPIKLQKGDKVMLTNEGIENIDNDQAWDEVPIKKGEVGEVVGWDDDDEVPIVQGPSGQRIGVHHSVLMHASEAAIKAQQLADAERKREEAAQSATKPIASKFNPHATPFFPASQRDGPQGGMPPVQGPPGMPAPQAPAPTHTAYQQPPPQFYPASFQQTHQPSQPPPFSVQQPGFNAAAPPGFPAHNMPGPGGQPPRSVPPGPCGPQGAPPMPSMPPYGNCGGFAPPFPPQGFMPTGGAPPHTMPPHHPPPTHCGGGGAQPGAPPPGQHRGGWGSACAAGQPPPK